jgi:ribosomal protein S18 acetylase RimI-like enzyme
MSEIIHITRLNPEDLQVAFQNISLFWEQVPSQEQLLSFLGEPSNILLAAWVGDQPAGQAIGYILSRWDANPPMLFLYSIDVLTPYRRRGVGSALVKVFRQVGREAGCGKTFVLTSENNLPAVALYTSTGASRPHDDDVLYVWEKGEE